MKTAIGPIFRLNRNEKKIKIKQISKALDISQSKISNFENERTTLSEKQIRELYLFIGFEYNNHNMDDLMKKIRFSVLSIYNCICYEKKDIAQKHQNLMEFKGMVKCSYPYITWLLGDFIYYVYYPKKAYDYSLHAEQLLDHLEYLEERFKQILYDTMGLYYKNRCSFDKANEYFNKALQISVSDTVTAMTNYHKGVMYNKCNKPLEALLMIQKAKQIFDENSNFYRSVMCCFEIGNVYMNLDYYEKAENMYKSCLRNVKKTSFEEPIRLYNNLLWDYLLWGKYNKVLYYGEKAIKIDSEFPMVYFYMAFSCWKTNNKELQKTYLKCMQNCMSNALKKNQLLMKAFTFYISNKNIKSKEKILVKAYESYIENRNHKFALFTLKLLAEMFQKEGEIFKELHYKNMILDLIKV